MNFMILDYLLEQSQNCNQVIAFKQKYNQYMPVKSKEIK